MYVSALLCKGKMSLLSMYFPEKELPLSFKHFVDVPGISVSA